MTWSRFLEPFVGLGAVCWAWSRLRLGRARDEGHGRGPRLAGREGDGGGGLDRLHAREVLVAHPLVAVRRPEHSVLPPLEVADGHGLLRLDPVVEHHLARDALVHGVGLLLELDHRALLLGGGGRRLHLVEERGPLERPAHLRLVDVRGREVRVERRLEVPGLRVGVGDGQLAVEAVIIEPHAVRGLELVGPHGHGLCVVDKFHRHRGVLLLR
mmetsp:Transcript_33857/g.80174  ORF Transcript_33857/g.80174 Transcript_33857/m.80174 type:complete len:213 (+) Transcript_33857:99-737(+)